MKQSTIAHPRALVSLLAAAALPATPAFAQDIVPLPAPPPVVTPSPPPTATVPVTPPPVVRTTPTPSPVTTPSAPPPAAEAPPAEPEAAPAQTERRATRRPPRERAAPPPEAAAPPPAAEAPAAPVTEIPPVIEPIAPPLAEAPAAPTETVAPEATTETGGTPWLPIAGALAVLAALIGFFLMRRRRRAEEDAYYEPAHEEAYAEPAPEPIAAPAVMTEPASAAAAAPGRAVFVDPALAAASISPTLAPASAYNADDVVPADDVAPAVAATTEAERPWIELSMRPVRAGTSDDDAVVEFELTVENAGSVPADDVKVSTWMFSANPAQSDAERVLIEPPADARLAELHLEPGDGKQMEATLALPKQQLSVVGSADHRAGFRPVVVADARYPLPDGGEGRISASFEIGLQSDTGELAPLHVDGAPELREDIEARLHGELERA